jgi:hypothetical protein
MGDRIATVTALRHMGTRGDSEWTGIESAGARTQ